MVLLKNDTDIISDLLYVFKKLYEKEIITKNEYIKAIQEVIQIQYKM